MGDSGRDVEVKIGAFGSTYLVKAAPEHEERIRSAAALLEKKVEETSADIEKPMTERIPMQLFYAALGITDELLMLREQVEDEQKSKGEQFSRLERIVDKSLNSRFVKLKMAYGAERREDD